MRRNPAWLPTLADALSRQPAIATLWPLASGIGDTPRAQAGTRRMYAYTHTKLSYTQPTVLPRPLPPLGVPLARNDRVSHAQQVWQRGLRGWRHHPAALIDLRCVGYTPSISCLPTRPCAASGVRRVGVCWRLSRSVGFASPFRSDRTSTAERETHTRRFHHPHHHRHSNSRSLSSHLVSRVLVSCATHTCADTRDPEHDYCTSLAHSEAKNAQNIAQVV